MKNVLRGILIFLGGLFSIEALYLFLAANFNAGYVIGLTIGLVLLGYGIFYNRINEFCRSGLKLWIKRAILICIGAVMAFSAFLQLYGMADNADYTEDAVIVLGAAVHGNVISRPLKYRLDETIKYLEKNEKAVVVVSGGQGRQENISEAAAMKIYLENKGISQNRIIMEDKAESTYENFVYSKNILDEKFKNEYTVVFITNEFHIFRAERIARKAGFEKLAHSGAKLDWYTVSINCFRECAAVAKFLIFGR